LVDENGLKLLSCVFSDDVLCSYRKDVGFRIMARCSGCPSYKKFEREMDEEDERVMNEVDEMRKNPERFSREDLR